MQLLRRMNKDRYGAVMLILLGTAVIAGSVKFHFGNLTHMGSGFMPTVYGVLMTIIGVVLGATAQRGPDSKPARAEWRGWLCIIGGVFAFVILGTYGGLVPATFAAVFISALADRNNSMRDAALLAVVIVIAGVLIFNVGLHLQLPLFSWR